jgi:hypothetical protein
MCPCSMGGRRRPSSMHEVGGRPDRHIAAAARVDVLLLQVSSLGLPSEARPQGERRMVDQTSASWNRVAAWLRRIEGIHKAA